MAVAKSALQSALVGDAGYIVRISSLMATIAKQVNGEDPSTAPRKAYAKKVLNGSRTEAAKVVEFLIRTDNFVGEDIEIAPFGSGFAVTMPGLDDADALSQIFTVWDTLVTLFG